MTKWESFRESGFTQHCDNPLECDCLRHAVKVMVRGLPNGTTYNRSYCECCGRVYGHKVIS